MKLLVFTVNQAGDDSKKNEFEETKNDPGKGEGYGIRGYGVHDEVPAHFQTAQKKAIADAFHDPGIAVSLRENQRKEEGEDELAQEHVAHVGGHFALGAPEGGGFEVEVFQNDAVNNKFTENHSQEYNERTDEHFFEIHALIKASTREVVYSSL